MKYKKFLLICILFIGGLLRFYHIDTVPPGLYQDEVSIGNNAYAILTTGKDEFGTPWPLSFKSFGDYKMPLYIYGTSLSIAIFGKNEFAVRFFSAFAGTMTILVLYLLLRELMKIDKEKLSSIYKNYLPIVSAFILAIFPWHIQFSRAGFETNVGLCFFLSGILITVYYMQKKDIKILIGAYAFFLLAFYTYHVYRIIVPLSLLAITFFLFYFNPKQRLQIFIVALSSIIVSFPMVFFSLTNEGQTRFTQASAFSEYGSADWIKSLLLYPMVYIKNYLSYFSLYFLFYSGDGFGRHQIPNVASLYIWELPFLFIGIYKLISIRKSILYSMVVFLFLLGPLAAAIARPSPHLLRSLLLVIPLTISIAVGILFVIDRLKRTRVLFLITLIGIGIFCFAYYVHMYYQHYSKTNIIDWGGGYKQIVREAEAYKKDYDVIIVDKYLKLAPYYFTFYSNSISPLMVDSSWRRPKSLEGKKILYIKPYYGPQPKTNLVDTIRISTQNNDIFSQFWKL